MASPRVDAIALAEHTLGAAQLILAVPPRLADDFEEAYAALISRREGREPLQHILGHAAFRRLRVRVTPGVFIPRPETEVVVQPAVDEARRLLASGRTPLVVDLCSGSGVIALSIASEAPGAHVVAIELDAAAVELARGNADLVRAQAPQVSSSRIRIERGNVTDPGLLAELDASVDIVISNPPYIPEGAVPLDPEVADHDPPAALFGGGTDGLVLPGHVVSAAGRLLRSGGLFVMEHADVQGPAVRELLDRTDRFEPATTHPDLTGRDRYVLTRRCNHT